MRRLTTKTAAARDKINALRIQKLANKAFIHRFEGDVGKAMNEGYGAAQGGNVRHKVTDEASLENFIRHEMFPKLTSVMDPDDPNNYLYGRGENHRASVYGFLSQLPAPANGQRPGAAAGIEEAYDMWQQGQQQEAIDSFIKTKNQNKINGFRNWLNMMTDDRIGYLDSHPAFSYITCRQVFDKVGSDKTGEPISARADYLGNLLEMFEESNDPNFNVIKNYEKLFGKSAEKAAGQNEGWIRIPLYEEEPNRLEENLELIHQISTGTSWCTGYDESTYRRNYYKNGKGQFYFFRRDGKSHCAILMYPQSDRNGNPQRDAQGKLIYNLQQLQSPKPNQPPPLEVADEVIDFLAKWEAGELPVGCAGLGDHVPSANYAAFKEAVQINKRLNTPEEKQAFAQMLQRNPEKFALLTKQNQQVPEFLAAVTQGYVQRLSTDPAAYGSIAPIIKSLPAIRNAFFQGITQTVANRAACPSLSVFANRLGAEAQKPRVQQAIKTALLQRFQTDPPTEAEANDLDIFMDDQVTAVIAQGIGGKIAQDPEYFFKMPDRIRQKEQIAQHAAQAFAPVAAGFFAENPSAKYYGMLEELAPEVLQQQGPQIQQAILQSAPKWLADQDRMSACEEVPEFFFDTPEGAQAAEQIFTPERRANPKNWSHIPKQLRDQLIDTAAVSAAIQRDCRIFGGLSQKQQRQNLVRFIASATQQVRGNQQLFNKLPEFCRNIDALCAKVGWTREILNQKLAQIGKPPIHGEPIVQAMISQDISQLIWARNWYRLDKEAKKKENWPVLVNAAIQYLEDHPQTVVNSSNIDNFAYPVAVAPQFRQRWEELKREYDQSGMQIHDRSRQIGQDLHPPQPQLPPPAPPAAPQPPEGMEGAEGVPPALNAPAEQPDPLRNHFGDPLGQIDHLMDQINAPRPAPPARRPRRPARRLQPPQPPPPGNPPNQAATRGWWKRIKNG